jgi:hypothetical protein
MCKLALLLLLSVSVAQAAPLKLLDCNTSFGPDQEVQVKQDGGKLMLIENTSHGSVVSRELTAAEWNSGVLNLREEFGYKTTLTVDKRGGRGGGQAYIHVTGGDRYNESGPADCE